MFNSDDQDVMEKTLTYQDFFITDDKDGEKTYRSAELIRTGEYSLIENYFLNPNNIAFMIPSYQRPFSWSKVDVAQLMDDILARDNLYLGSTIIDPCRNRNATVKIVDGQQRLTVVSLICHALFTPMFKPYTKHFKQLDEANLLYKDYDTKLQLRSDLDNSSYDYILRNKETDAKNKMMAECYKMIMHKLNEMSSRKGQLKTFIVHLLHATVITKLTYPYEDARLIYADVNAKSVSLTDFDLIRQYMLDDEDARKASVALIRSFDKTEEILTENEDKGKKQFIDYYLRTAIPTSRASGRWKDYMLFKKMCESRKQNGESVRDIATEMEKYADIYKQLMSGRLTIGEAMSWRDIVEAMPVVKPATPLIMHLLYDYQYKKDTSANAKLKLIVRVLMTFGIRARLTGVKSLGQIFPDFLDAMYDATNRLMKEQGMPFKEACFAQWKTLFSVRPDIENAMLDSTVQSVILNTSFKLEGNEKAFCRLLLSGIENRIRKEAGIETGLADILMHAKTMEIDHRMPKNPDQSQLALLGLTREEVDAWSGRLGNLHFMQKPLNVRKSNKATSFYDSTMVTHFNLDDKKAKGSSWSVEDIKERTSEFAEYILKEWPEFQGKNY